eukprot:TRINITY_DN4265_c0_g1_i1.p2 TRINITY_DN4265_c0_g1~~TRINITY_DN4265_c0_g1_i1.p2  ORF type:complete len:141 (-),score=36.67 TRINITY_DN4265_c0_g1_i1:794-1216(-)
MAERRQRQFTSFSSTSDENTEYHWLSANSSVVHGQTQTKRTIGVHAADIETGSTTTELVGGEVGVEVASQGSTGGELRARLNVVHHEGDIGEVSIGPRLDTGFSYGKHFKAKLLGFGVEGGSDGVGLSVGLLSFKVKKFW